MRRQVLVPVAFLLTVVAMCLYFGLTRDMSGLFANLNLTLGAVSIGGAAAVMCQRLHEDPKNLWAREWVVFCGFGVGLSMNTVLVADQSLFSYFQGALLASSMLFLAACCRPQSAASAVAIADLFFRLMTPVMLLVPLTYFATPGALAGFDWVGSLPGWGNVRTLGFMAMISAAVFLSGCLRSRTTPMDYAGLFAAGFLVFWSGSRSATVGLAVMLVVVASLAFRTRTGGWSMVTAGAVLGIALAASGFAAKPSAEYGILQRIEATAAAVATGADPSSNRLSAWAAGLEAIMERPWGGWGYLHYFRVDDPRFVASDVHNYIIDIAFSWGLPATAMILACIWGIPVTALIQSWRRRDISALMPLGCASALLSAGLFGGLLPVTSSRVMLCILLGALVAWLRDPACLGPAPWARERYERA